MQPIRFALSLLALSITGQALAGGFALNEQSASAMGTAFAGRSSSALDASTVYGNPAGMSYLGEQVSGGLAVIKASTDIDHASAKSANGQPYNGTNKGDMVPLTTIPFGYYVKPLNEQWRFGLGVYAPFGLMTDYEKSFQGRRYADKSEVKVIAFQPTLSYKIDDRWSVGAGVTANYIEGTLSSAFNPIGLPTTEGQYKVSGDDWSWGYNLGVIFQVTESTRIGATYRSKVDYTLKGKAENTVSRVPTGLTPPLPTTIPVAAGKYNASLDVTTPESFELSVTQQFDDQWTGYAGYTWTRWSRFQEVVAESPNNAFKGFREVREEQNWKDTRGYAMGLSYQLDPQWQLRGGVAFDPTPTNNHDRSPRIPTGDRYVFTLGAGYQASANLTVDLAYAYLREEQVNVNKFEAAKGSYSAQYKNSAHALSTQLTWSF